jgi:hypothetical protein
MHPHPDGLPRQLNLNQTNPILETVVLRNGESLGRFVVVVVKKCITGSSTNNGESGDVDHDVRTGDGVGEAFTGE